VDSDTPKITIIIPIIPSYNEAPFIEQTIRSVQEQDYPHVQRVDTNSFHAGALWAKSFSRRLPAHPLASKEVLRSLITQ